MRLILASTSPRRREILALLGLPFDVISPQFDESVLDHRPIHEEVLDFALGKAQSVAQSHPDSMVIGSDTMILIDGQKIGKPVNMSDAKKILRTLGGKTHKVVTSIAILDNLGGPGLRTVEEVSVVMRDYSDKEVDDYLSRDESLDKAGAYSIQGEGRALIESIDGDYLTAVGLPLMPVARYLRKRGLSFPLDLNKLYAEKTYRNWKSFQ
ncbi:MAG: septum formation protein Maf [Deltaproteobacteria bacterium]|nr:septum formation protein Maf [Deltaproteobacteria bacterium]